MDSSINPQNYEQFKGCMMILMHFENLSTHDIEDDCQEWYSHYKLNECDNVLEWSDFYFRDVTRNSHNYWVSEKGRLLLQLSNAFDAHMKSGNFSSAIDLVFGQSHPRNHQED